MVKPLLDGEERWLSVVGYEGLYLVSNHGRVYSEPRTEFVQSKRTGGHLRFRNGGFLKPFVNKFGYAQISLRNDTGLKLHLVHRLVAFAFLPNPDKEVNHINGVRSDNRLENLEWSNRRHNALHGTRVLGKNRGEDNFMTKLSKEEVLEIKNLLEQGLTQTEISKQFNVTNHAIFRIQHGYNWSWLTGYERKVGER